MSKKIRWIYLLETKSSSFYYFTHCKFVIAVLTGGLSLETEWQQVSMTLLHILTYPTKAVICMILIFFLSSWDCSKHTNYNWCHFHLSQLFQLSSKIQILVCILLLVFFFPPFDFYSVVCCNSKIHEMTSFSFLVSFYPTAN